MSSGVDNVTWIHRETLLFCPHKPVSNTARIPWGKNPGVRKGA
jgi:hypothetical protein